LRSDKVLELEKILIELNNLEGAVKDLSVSL